MKRTYGLWMIPAAAVAFAACSDSTGPGGTPIDGEWSGQMEAGDVLEIRGINGGISASAATVLRSPFEGGGPTINFVGISAVR